MSANKKTQGFLAVFNYLDDFCDAVNKIEDDPDFKDHKIYSHTSYHELMDIAEKRLGSSGVKWFTLFGALLGVCSGFGMCLLCDYDWAITVGGKPGGIASLPAYVILGFEMMILLGAIFTILGMLVLGRLPDPRAVIYDERLTDDKFAVFVPSSSADSQIAQKIKSMGAQEIFDR